MNLILQILIFIKRIFYDKIKLIRLYWKQFTDQTILSTIESDQRWFRTKAQ